MTPRQRWQFMRDRITEAQKALLSFEECADDGGQELLDDRYLAEFARADAALSGLQDYLSDARKHVEGTP